MVKRKKYRPKRVERGLQEALRNFIEDRRKESRFTHAQLAGALTKHGLNETADSVRHKIRRGTFSATFLLFTLQALGIALIPWRELGMPEQERNTAEGDVSRAKKKINQKIKDGRDLYKSDIFSWTRTVQPRHPFGK